MLKENEKEKIQLEEQYRNEVRKSIPAPKSFFDRFDGPIKFFQFIAIALGIFATVWQYKLNSDNAQIAAAREYQKSFYQAQMSVYAEAVNEVSILSNVDADSTEYAQARKIFFQLFWGRMSIFEDKCVEAKMVEFQRLLIKFEQQDFRPISFNDSCSANICVYDTVTQETLRLAALRLAHQCRIYTLKTWLPESEQKNYNIVEEEPCKTN
ncbi:hypothetical protein CLV51_106172 [Chitinophaga niastensis]|uniref:Uncharacterized protein n=1 Tax=Chitinophaga niastensis TaxID=536980 RepID=A0A2P8HDI9_CHINA|nr:hypothetical protein [Chitinophaga niastensis]PSL44306.1 hypothetical protein CLV51_106172 [Chitinophaga niastensis]